MNTLIGTIAAALTAASLGLPAYAAEQGISDLEKQRRTTSGTPNPKDLSTGTERGAKAASDCSKLSGEARDNCLDCEWLRKQRKLSDGPPPPDAKPARSETMRDQAGYTAASKKDCAHLSGDAKENCMDSVWLRHQRRMSEGTPKGDPVGPKNPDKR